MHGIIEDSTGDLLRAGFVAFAPGPGESLRTDVPIPSYVRGQSGVFQMSRWSGTQWILVPQPPAVPQDATFGTLTATTLITTDDHVIDQIGKGHVVRDENAILKRIRVVAGAVIAEDI